MGLVFKNLGKDNIQITPHTARKQWDLSLSDSAAIGIKSYKGSYIPGDFNISDSDVGFKFFLQQVRKKGDIVVK